MAEVTQPTVSLFNSEVLTQTALMVSLVSPLSFLDHAYYERERLRQIGSAS